MPTAPPKPKANTGPKPRPEADRRSKVLHVRVYPDFAEWVDGYATARGMSITKLVEDTLRTVAKLGGYKPEPPAPK